MSNTPSTAAGSGDEVELPDLSSFYNSVKATVQKLERYLQNVPLMVKISRSSGVRPIYVFTAGIVLLASSIVDGWGVNLFIGTAGLAYPSWMSFKAIESHDEHAQVTWLAYWLVYALFSFSESLLYWLVSRLPSYWLLRSLFILWLVAPQFQGATVIYKKVIRGLLIQHLDEIQSTVRVIENTAQNAFGMIRASAVKSATVAD